MATAGPGSAVGPPGLQSSWPLTTRAACGRGSEAFRCGPGARAAPASQGVKEAAAGPAPAARSGSRRKAAVPSPILGASPALRPHPSQHPAPSESWDTRTPAEPPASRLRGPATCYQRPARSVEETVVTRGHQSVAEGHRETAPGPAARSGAPRGAAPRIQGALVVITVIFSCSRFFFSSR